MLCLEPTLSLMHDVCGRKTEHGDGRRRPSDKPRESARPVRGAGLKDGCETFLVALSDDKDFGFAAAR